MYCRPGGVIQDFLNAGRVATGVPHLTFRHCRTTFATLYRKPILDRQKASVGALDARLTGKVVTMPVRESA
jgi:hypothetical protein